VLRVALDLAPTRLASAGVARYARGVSSALAARDDVTVEELGAGPVLERGTFRRRALALRQDLAWYPLGLRRAARERHAAVLHLVTLRGPLRDGRPPAVLTVHDLAPLHHAETLAAWNRYYTKATLQRVLGAAAVVVADSADGADELDRTFPWLRIRVVHPGVDPRFLGAPPPGLLPVDGPYVLFVGTPEPRKNLERLAEAMRGRGERLVLAGGAGWGDVEPPGALRLGHVDDDTLHRLYAHAACLAIPSLHEGFGYPAVEAMAAGCPVVASTAGALPEVTGGAAVLVDPLVPDAIAAGIDEALARAPELREAGRRRAAELTWERTGDGLVAAYREAIAYS
jgi:glycosyltransferase involved in cell wall biosynthesis